MTHATRCNKTLQHEATLQVQRIVIKMRFLFGNQLVMSSCNVADRSSMDPTQSMPNIVHNFKKFANLLLQLQALAFVNNNRTFKPWLAKVVLLAIRSNKHKRSYVSKEWMKLNQTRQMFLFDDFFLSVASRILMCQDQDRLHVIHKPCRAGVPEMPNLRAYP